jgi:hypothetical protein
MKNSAIKPKYFSRNSSKIFLTNPSSNSPMLKWAIGGGSVMKTNGKAAILRWFRHFISLGNVLISPKNYFIDLCRFQSIFLADGWQTEKKWLPISQKFLYFCVNVRNFYTLHGYHGAF